MTEPTKVYLALRHIPYEGFDILGIFSSKEKAEACVLEQKEDSYVEHSVDEWEVK